MLGLLFILSSKTTFAQDETAVDAIVVQIDALGRYTHWTRDHEGRATSRTLPLGMTETMVYDPNGNLTSHTDFNGNTITYTYDTMDRLLDKTFPDGSKVSFTYNKNGRRKSETTELGTTLAVLNAETTRSFV